MEQNDKPSGKKIKQPVKGGVAKVPFIMQMEALECGAASLAMVLAFFGKWVPLEQVRCDCGVSRDGSNGRNILLAARSYGLNAAGYRMEPEYLRDNGSFPCIAHWEFNHFVVVNGFKKDRVYLNDPAKGTYSVPMKEFDEKFTGICMMFEPSESFAAGGRQKSTIEFARKRLKGYGAAIAFVIITGIISSLIGVINPVFSRIFMDRLLTGKDPSWYIPFIIVISVFGFIQILSGLIQALYSRRIDGKMSVYGTSSYMWKLFNLPMDFYSQRYAGDILSRRAGNASISNSLIYTFAPLALKALMMIFYLAVMLSNSVILTLVGISSIVVNMFISRIYLRKARQPFKDTDEGRGEAFKLHDGRNRDDRDNKGERRRGGIFPEMGGISGERQHAESKVCEAQSVLGFRPVARVRIHEYARADDRSVSHYTGKIHDRYDNSLSGFPLILYGSGLDLYLHGADLTGASDADGENRRRDGVSLR